MEGFTKIFDTELPSTIKKHKTIMKLPKNPLSFYEFQYFLNY